MSENALIYEEDRFSQEFTYELSLWTLYDSFITVFKWAYMDVKGQIQEPSFTMSDDGTRNLSFSIPKFYYIGPTKMANPMWHRIEEQPIEANMHKLKVIFNKNTEDEAVEEFLVTSVTHTHTQDNIKIEVAAEGLAFHELGKIGYKISLSADDYENDYKEWFEAGADPASKPLNNIQYWNDKIFKDGNRWKLDWQYEIQMNWSSFSGTNVEGSDTHGKLSNKVYEDEYIASWDIDSDYNATPREVESYKEKYRNVDASESNIYNITQDIAKTFGVFCRYQYQYDQQYHIIGKKVIYYNNYWQEARITTANNERIVTTHLDLTYPYTSSSIKRVVDNTDIVTKMFVRPVDSTDAAANIISIMDVAANRSREDYILNFDYLYKIGTITEEQYQEISKYEAKMYSINSQLIEVEKKIEILQNELTEEEAKITYYGNAKIQDDEQINANVKARRAENGGNDIIKITESNPGKFSILSSSKNGKFIKLNYEGLSVGSLKVYETFQSAEKANKKLTNRNTSGVPYYHPVSGELTMLTQLKLKTDTNLLYVTCEYCPSSYYDNIIKEWEKRLNEDTAAEAAAIVKKEDIIWQLYGTNPPDGFEYTESEHLQGVASAILSDENCKVGTAAVVAENRVSIVNGQTYIQPLNNFTSNLIGTQESLLELKKQMISAFERMMGPALREGYWTPEDYNDYGDKYLHTYSVPYSYNPENTSNSEPQLTSFVWDDNKIDNSESSLTFKSSISDEETQYIIIDLSECIDEVINHLDDLSFIYFDPTSMKELDALVDEKNTLEAKSSLTADERARLSVIIEEIDILKENSKCSFTIGSTCEFGWVEDSSVSSNHKIKPVLIVTGSHSFSDEQLTKLYQSVSSSIYYPYLGTYEATYEDGSSEVTYKINRLTGITATAISNDRKAQLITLNSSIKQVYPRIFVNSLKLKTESDDTFISLNGTNLKKYEDYSILSVSKNENNSYTIGYYITLKSETLLKTQLNTSIQFAFTLSNADVSIYLDGLKVMKENAFPKVSYDIELCALDYNLLRTAYTKLNYLVHINDLDLQLQDVCGYISSITIPLDKIWETTAEIKNYETKFEDLFSTIVAQTEQMQKNEAPINAAIGLLSTGGTIDPDVLQTSLLKADLNYSFDQGELTIDQVNGIWGTSADGVVAFRGGGIFTATEKDENGKWQWNTGILPGGINADLITTGQLDTNKIRIYAGDKVRFQLNGQGLFAYKSLFDDELILQSTDGLTQEEADPIINENNKKEQNYSTYMDTQKRKGIVDIDPNVYVTFNGLGLFLVAKQGALIWDKETEDNPTPMMKDVNKVEISWSGLILRNNNNDKVFYADDTGNLTLTGQINATSGQIGGWTINNNALESASIRLVGGSNSYITLTESVISDAPTSISYNNKTYKAYKDNSNNIYYKADNENKYYTLVNKPVRATPKYRYTVEYATQTVEYVVTDKDSEEILTYNGASIYYTLTYNEPDAEHVNVTEDTSLNSTWYKRLLGKFPTTIGNYVIYEYDDVLEEASGISNPTAYTINPTFQITNAGELKFTYGEMDQFILKNHVLDGQNIMSIKNTNLSGTNYVEGNSNYSLSKYKNCFCSFSSNSSKGTFTLTTVAGKTQNFNIASTKFFKTKMMEASNSVTGRQSASVNWSDSGNTISFSTTGVLSNSFTFPVTGSNSTFGKRRYDAGYSAGRNSVSITATLSDNGIQKSNNTLFILYQARLSNSQIVYGSSTNTTLVPAIQNAVVTGTTVTANGYKSGNYFYYRGVAKVNGVTKTSSYIRYTISSGGGTHTCFAGGTPITLPDGKKQAIETLTVGTQVLGYDEEVKEIKPVEVVGIQSFKHSKNIVDVHLSNNKIIRMTKSHPLLTDHGWAAIDVAEAEYEHRYISISELKTNDHLVSSKEDVYINEIIDRPDLDGTLVYNIDVEPYDTYIVEDIVAHNVNVPVKTD